MKLWQKFDITNTVYYPRSVKIFKSGTRPGVLYITRG